jgi:hypothetical protein
MQALRGWRFKPRIAWEFVKGQPQFGKIPGVHKGTWSGDFRAFQEHSRQVREASGWQVSYPAKKVVAMDGAWRHPVAILRTASLGRAAM